MADLIQNVQEVFKKWESRPVSNRGRSRGGAYRNRPQRPRYEERQSSFRSSNFRDSRKPRYFEPKYEALAEFKMVPTVAPSQNSRPYLGMPCAKCAPRSRGSVDDATVYLLSVYNTLHIPYIPIRETLNICCILNLFKMNKPFTTPDFSHDLLKSKQVEEVMQNVVDRQDKDIEVAHLNEIVYKKSQEILHGLKSSLTSVYVALSSFCLHYIFKKMFSGIFVHKSQMEVLKILKKEDIPFVYLPLHRTYFDYILPSYILHLNSVNTPFIVVPERLRIPFLSSFLKMLGAIFVKDEFLLSDQTSDCLYDIIAKNYVLRCLGSHNDILFFLEKSYSITGKPQVPNMNLLSAVVNAVSEGLLEDVYIVPVSILCESSDNHASQQLQSDSNKTETSLISKLFHFWKFLHLKYGNVRVNFNQPFSMKEFLKENSKSCHSFNVDRQVLTESQTYVKDLASHIIYDAIQSSSLMCTHLLAFLFVTQYREGAKQQQLESNMDWLREEINKKKWDLGFSGESLPAIKRAVELLGKDLISTETIEMEWTSSDLENNNVKVKVFTPVLKLPHVLELQYYANAVMPVFVKESIVVSALYALVDVDICHFHHFDSRFFVFRDELLQKSIKLSNFLKYEFFISPPCQESTTVFNDVIDHLIEKECLSSTGPDQRYFRPNKKSHALSFTVSSDEESDSEIMQQLKIDLREESIRYLEFLRNVLSPYVESYWLAACSLLKLIDEVKEESVFIREMQMTAEEKLYKGLLAYEESFSASTLKNSLKMFCDHNIIECYVIDNIKTLCLSEPFNSFEAINEIIADIEDFRK